LKHLGQVGLLEFETTLKLSSTFWTSSNPFLFAIQTDWGIELLTVYVRQVLYFAIQLGYPLEILV
jgi:hypothetical protein